MVETNHLGGIISFGQRLGATWGVVKGVYRDTWIENRETCGKCIGISLSLRQLLSFYVAGRRKSITLIGEKGIESHQAYRSALWKGREINKAAI